MDDQTSRDSLLRPIKQKEGSYTGWESFKDQLVQPRSKA